MHTRHEVIIPIDDAGKSNWTLRIARENNSPHVEVALHWGEKTVPTHLGLVLAKEFGQEIQTLLSNQTVV